MRWQTTAILAAILITVGAFYYVYDVRMAPDREKAASVKDRLWKELEGKDVDDIVVETSPLIAAHGLDLETVRDALLQEFGASAAPGEGAPSR